MIVIERLAGPSSRYRTAWIAGVTGRAVVGVLSSFVLISLPIDITVLAITATMFGSVQVPLGMAQGLKLGALTLSALDGSVRAALLALAVCGYVAAVGASTLLLLLVIAGTSPPVVSYLSDQAPNRCDVPTPARTPAAQGHAVPMPMPNERRELADLTLDELCWVWRHSFAVLLGSRTDSERLAVVGQRERVLGELERRDADALAKWLGSGPRAAGNPAPFFIHQADYPE